MSNKTTTEQIEIWKSDFGRAWVDRNCVDPVSRVDAFRTMLNGLPIGNVLEVGCAQGHNLIALSNVSSNYSLCGIEPNQYAIETAKGQGLDVRNGNCFKIPFDNNAFDLVFTAGVLMHVAPEDLSEALTEISRVSRAYILVIEYRATADENPIYRGYDRLLYKRNYGVLLRTHGLNYIRRGHWGKGSGFDGCSWWLCRPPICNPCSKSPIGQHHWIIEDSMICKHCGEIKAIPAAVFIPSPPRRVRPEDIGDSDADGL